MMKKRNRVQERIEFTVRFKILLAARGHSEKSLGELKEILKVSRTLIHQWLNNGGLPSPFSAGIICDEFDCSYEWLLVGRGAMEGFKMASPDEVALIEQYRNMTVTGRKKLMRYAFSECIQHELVSKTKEDKQAALKLIIKPQ